MEKAIEHVTPVRAQTAEEASELWTAEESVTPNRFADMWLLTLGLILALTLLCTGVLVAWPILARIASGLN